MSRKYQQDPKTGLVRQPLSNIIFGGVFFFVISVMTSMIHPYFSRDSLYLSIPMGILGFGSLIWINLRPNLHARFFLNIGIASLWMLVAFRAFGNLLPQFSFWAGAMIFATTIFAHTLPMWNSSAAQFIRDELSAPKTRIGKIIFRASLLLIPIAGVLGATAASILHPGDKSKGLSFILAGLGWFLAVVLPFAYRFPSSPWEGKEK